MWMEWFGSTVTGKRKDIAPRLLCLLCFSMSLSASAVDDDKPWSTELYGAGWSPTPRLSFAADKIIQDFSYAGYANGEKAIPDMAEARRFDVVADFGADASGVADATESIQKAINAASAAGGGVV